MSFINGPESEGVMVTPSENNNETQICVLKEPNHVASDLLAEHEPDLDASLYVPTPSKEVETSFAVELIEHRNVMEALQNELRPINFYEKAGLQDGESITKRHNIIIVVEEVLEAAKKNHWSLCVADGFVYVFNSAYWKQLSKDELLHFLGKAAERLGVDIYDARYYTFRADLLKQFYTYAYLPKPQRKTEEVLINLKNGTFVIKPGEQYLRPFERRDFLTYQLPFGYDKDAKAPLFEKYLQRVLPDEQQQRVLAEYIGSVFVRQKTLKLEKSLILYGGGANGKSVFFEVITALLGSENVSNFSLQSLTNETGYQRAKLNNKLLNYASEISTHLETTLFKQLVSGEPVEARLPYGEPFILEDYAKLLFNTNTLPKDVEQTEAFFRRFIILNFNVTIPEEERDPHLASKIIDQELSGVFNWILEGLSRLLQQKRFTYSEAVENMVDQYRRQSDTVQLFLADEGYVLDNNGQTGLKDMYYEYKNYCNESGYKACSLKVFSERLRNQGFELHRKKKGNVVNALKKPFD